MKKLIENYRLMSLVSYMSEVVEKGIHQQFFLHHQLTGHLLTNIIQLGSSVIDQYYYFEVVALDVFK